MTSLPARACRDCRGSDVPRIVQISASTPVHGQKSGVDFMIEISGKFNSVSFDDHSVYSYVGYIMRTMQMHTARSHGYGADLLVD